MRWIRSLELYAPFIVLRSGFSKAERMRWTAYRNFHSRYKFLLDGKGPNKTQGPKVMFVHLIPQSHVALIEGMFAKSLELCGCQAIFVLHRLNIWSESYLRAFGYRDFIYVDDDWPEAREYERLADEMFGRCQSATDIMNLRFREADVGRHALSTALAWRRAAFVDFADWAILRDIRKALVLSMRTVVAAEKIINRIQPDKLLVCEGGYSPLAEFYDVSLRHQVDTIRWFYSHQEHSLLFRRYRYEDRYEHFFTLSDETWSQIKQMPWSVEQGEAVKESLKASYLTGIWFKRKNMLHGKVVKTPDQIRRELNLNPAKPTAVVFSHVLWDATFWYGRNLFQDYGTWLIETIRAACRNPNVNWIIKMHPDNVWKEKEYRGNQYALEQLDEYRLIRKHFPELPPHVVLMPPEHNTNPVSFFGFADYAITVRGTVGLEFPCFGTPALTAGTGRYSGRGFTCDFERAEEYLKQLERIQDIPPLGLEETALAQRFVYAVFNLRPLPFQSFSWKRNLSKQLDAVAAYDFEINVPTIDELKKARDLSLFADWILKSNQSDFLIRDGSPQPFTNSQLAREPSLGCS